MSAAATTLSTPIGELALVADDDVIVAAGFTSVESMARRLPGSQMPTIKADLGAMSRAVAAYFAGDLAAIDDLAVSQPGGAFQQAAWKVMRDVPAGEVITYTELAARAGNAKAVRAAGSACARNLIAPIVPCHRILRSDGTLGGYAYSLPSKRWLLDYERRLAG